MYTAVLFLATVFSVCTTPFAGAQQPLPDPVVHLTFDDPNDLGNDSSGNGRHGVVGVTGVTWQRDAERQGVADFTDTAFSADTSIMVDLGGPLPGDDFTVACWMTSRANTGSFFQLEPVEDPPVAQTGTFEKVVWGGMSGSGFVWGRIVENGDDFSGLDTNVYMTDLNVWHHYAYRGRADATSSTGFRFEVFVDGNQVGPQTEYAGTLNTHGQLNVGCTHNGRVDDVRVYNIALSDSQIKDLTLPQLPTPVLHLTFDDESAPYADSSPTGAVVTGEGSASAPAWVDDPERRGSMSFDSLGIDGAGGAGRSYLCTAVDIAEGDEWTITTWAKRKNIGDGNGGVFVMGREQENVCDIDGANDFRSWIGHTGIAPGVWGRVAEADPASFKQICKRDGTDPVLEFDVWTHLALRTDGTTVLQLLVDGQQVCESFTNGDTMGYSERLLIGNAHVGTFPGLLDDFRLYNVALTDGQIGTIISGLCPAEGDSHCLSMTIEGPPQRKRGIYRVEVDASDDSGDVIFYTFLAEKTGDPSATLLIEAQRDDPSASFYLSPGEWQISVTADDGPCPDEASDATCSLDALNLIQVIPGEPSLDNVDFHFSFDDANDPLVDNSGNGFVATWSPANSEQWVNDSVRGGVLEFPGVTQETEADRDPEDGYIKVKDGPKTVGIDARGIDRDGGGFTICVWVNQFSDANAPGTFGSGGIFNYSNCCDEDGDGVIGDPYVTPGDHDGPGWNWNPLNPDRLTNAAVTVSSGDPNDPSFAFTWNGGDGAPRGGNIGGDFPSDTWTHMCLRGSIPDVHPTQALFTHRVEMVINGTQLPDRDGDEPPFAHSREDFGLQQISRAYLGKGNNPQSASFRGRLDDWRHYDRMLSNAEIQEVMEGFVEPFDIDYIRGDANGSGVPDVSDAIGILTYLFLGGFETTCLDALDFDGTTIIDVSDSLNFLSWLFLGTYTPPNPIPPACGLPDDPLTRISCESFAPCE